MRRVLSVCPIRKSDSSVSGHNPADLGPDAGAPRQIHRQNPASGHIAPEPVTGRTERCSRFQAFFHVLPPSLKTDAVPRTGAHSHGNRDMQRVNQTVLTPEDKPGKKSGPGILRLLLRERRSRQRLRLELAVRFLDADGSEQQGRLLDISASGIAVASDRRPDLRSPIVCYLDSIGGYEGIVCRHLSNGFAVRFKTSKGTQEKLVERIMAAANNMPDDLRQSRRHLRFSVEETAHIEFEDGSRHNGTIIDLSVSGLGVRSAFRPPIGARVKIGMTRGTVIRHLDEGFAIEFAQSLTFDRLCSRTLNSALFRSVFERTDTKPD